MMMMLMVMMMMMMMMVRMNDDDDEDDDCDDEDDDDECATVTTCQGRRRWHRTREGKSPGTASGALVSTPNLTRDIAREQLIVILNGGRSVTSTKCGFSIILCAR